MLGISTDTWAIHIEGERVGHGDRSADEYRAGYTDSASLERGVGSRGIPGMRRDDLVGRRCNCGKAMSQHRPGVSFLFISLIGTARGGRAGAFGTLAASTPRFCRAPQEQDDRHRRRRGGGDVFEAQFLRMQVQRSRSRGGSVGNGLTWRDMMSFAIDIGARDSYVCVMAGGRPMPLE